MGIRVALRHLTEYSYDRRVNLLPHTVRLRPAPHCRTPIQSYSLRIDPAHHYINWQQDPYGNYVARVSFPRPSDRLQFEVDLIAELSSVNPFDFFLEEGAETFPFAYDEVLGRELGPYLEKGASGPRFHDFVARLRRTGVRTVDHVVDINRRLQGAVRYLIRMEPGVQGCEETLALGSGSCRDSAWLLVQILRHLGLAARFTSGYLIQLAPDLKPCEGPPGPATDFTDLHAWAEVYLPGAGWIGLDPTSGLLAGEGHLPLACAADPITAAPITGSFSLQRQVAETDGQAVDGKLRFDMSVARMHETARSTRPCTEEEWRAVEALGARIDEALAGEDVRLTLGGEPTFVSTADRDAPEWNTAALGDRKLARAGELLGRLRERFAPGGLLHHGQGKWYPGEPLPRWALGCYWRQDGQPIWRDPRWLATAGGGYSFTTDDAGRLLVALARRLGLPLEHILPAHEDAWYYLWRERRLPENVDPLDSKLEDPEERSRFARTFERGLGAVVGFALPLRRERCGEAGRWVSGPWFLRSERLYLLPGDSPMGYRLPLDSLPWEAAIDRHAVHAPDPMSHGPEAGARAAGGVALATRQQASPVALAGRLTGTGAPAWQGPGATRTALCSEARGGQLFVFLPPVPAAADYLDLISIIEGAAAELELPVFIEGYPPPYDPGLGHFQIAPDPGVIEVNLHPSRTWRELADRTTALYEEARRTGLTAEKYLVDGRAVGTGGGNHIVLGGPTPAESPFLRRPDLLRSLLAYWQNHPSLSYFFGGLCLGPTSQAPRVDEARHESLYELELAFAQLPPEEARASAPPWLVDRVFRHLLIDASGNTHRAEFSIDKLYSPDSSAGRRGLLELRSFEMPPHERMSLTAQLLVRALIAWFWKTPYRRRLVRWGTELHDRFLLPHFLEQDLEEVLEDLALAGFPFEGRWFEAQREHRFPPIGGIACRGIHLELRPALEPWNVLGEETGAGGAVRYIDSSVERLQVKVRGLTPDRFTVACNGRAVPLHPTGVPGEHVAGVRFRAWQPPSCLHPTIPVHSPLVLDIIDGWRGRAIGGCTYHVSHPGGRAFETLPVNASEAESRWKSRFWPFGHTPGPLSAPRERAGELPMTLDLRRPPAREAAG